MLDICNLGWQTNTLGELDHTRVKAPYVRMSHYTIGENNDIVYVYDLRLAQPNIDCLAPDLQHSFEHCLLAGFRKHLGKYFISIAPMGCQTGFYLVTLNVGEKERVYNAYEATLLDILDMKVVPYANIKDCGQYVLHNLIAAQKLASNILIVKNDWDKIV